MQTSLRPLILAPGMSCQTDEPNNVFPSIDVVIGHRAEILALEIDERTNTLFSASADRTVRAWDLDTISCRRTLVCSTGHITCIHLCIASESAPADISSPSGSGGGQRSGVLAVGSDAGFVHIFSLRTLEEVYLLRVSSQTGPHAPVRAEHIVQPQQKRPAQGHRRSDSSRSVGSVSSASGAFHPVSYFVMVTALFICWQTLILSGASFSFLTIWPISNRPSTTWTSKLLDIPLRQQSSLLWV